MASSIPDLVASTSEWTEPWSAAVAHVRENLRALMGKTLACHKGKHGYQVASGCTAVLLGTAGMVSFFVFPPLAAGLWVATGVASTSAVGVQLLTWQLERKAKKKLTKLTARLEELTPELLKVALDIWQALVKELGEFELSDLGRETLRRSYNYQWWSGARAVVKPLLEGKAGEASGLTLKGMAEKVAKTVKLTDKGTQTAAKIAAAKGGAELASNFAKVSASVARVATVTTGAASVALEIVFVGISSYQLHNADEVNKCYVIMEREIGRLETFINVMLDLGKKVAADKEKGLSDARGRLLEVLMWELVCTHCEALDSPIPCADCGRWSRCRRCLLSDGWSCACGSRTQASVRPDLGSSLNFLAENIEAACAVSPDCLPLLPMLLDKEAAREGLLMPTQTKKTKCEMDAAK